MQVPVTSATKSVVYLVDGQSANEVNNEVKLRLVDRGPQAPRSGSSLMQAPLTGLSRAATLATRLARCGPRGQERQLLFFRTI